jgi:hypothetical protein
VLHLNLAREAAGAAGTRHSLRPLFSRDSFPSKTRAVYAARSRSCVCRHCEERSDEAIHCHHCPGCGLLRFARNDGRTEGNAPHSQPSSPGLTGRPSIPETLVMESRSRGVLDTPLEPIIGLAEAETRWRGMTAIRADRHRAPVRLRFRFAQATPDTASASRSSHGSATRSP